MNCKLLLILCALPSVLMAQPKGIIDSLEKAALQQKDTSLIKTYNELTWQYRSINPSKALGYGRQAVELSSRYHFDKGLAQAFNDMGIIHYYQQSFDSALLLYYKALDIRKRLNDLSGIAKLYNKIGIVHQQAGRFDKALEIQLLALPIFEQLQDNIGISYSLNNIGILHQNMDRYAEAIRYQEQSIAIKEKIRDRYGLAGSYVNVGNVYMIQQNAAKAKEYYSKAVDMSRQIGDNEYLAGALNSLGKLLITAKQYNEALLAIQESYELRKTKNDRKGMVKSLVNIGDAYIALKQVQNANAALSQALLLAKDEEACKPELPAIYKSLSELYEKENKYEMALQNYKLSARFKDTIYTDNVSSKFAELQIKYETEKKNFQIALLGKDNSIKALTIRNQDLELDRANYALTQKELKLSEASLQIARNELSLKNQEQTILKQKLEATERAKNIENLQKQTAIQSLEIQNRQLALNRRNTILFSLIGLFLLTSLLGYSFYRRKQLQQNAQLQAAILKQQGEAIKAVLAAEEAERQRIAKDLHDGVGQMMSAAKMNLSAYEHSMHTLTANERSSFEKIIQLVDESCAEVRAVSHNMMPNALLKNNLDAAIREFISKLDEERLKVHFYSEGLDQRLDANMETVLYRVIQECVNNVIKHSDANLLDITIIKEAKELTATIEDNGKGFDIADKAKFDGIGLKNIRTRVEYLKGSVDFNSTPGRGTLVALHVPL